LLDTLAPDNLVAKLNNGALYTSSTSVTLGVTVDDADTTGYQMKILGVDGVAAETDASWETFAASKAITLPTGDGLKTVNVKVRDDVGNETAAATLTITLVSDVQVVTVTGPDKSKISKVAGFDAAVISFMADVAFVAYKVCVVPAENSLVDAAAANAQMEIPPVMVERKIDEMVQNFEYRLQSQGLNLPTYLQYAGMDMAAFREGFAPQAEQQVRVSLTLEAIAKAENLEAEEEAIEAEYQKMADAYGIEVDKVRGVVAQENIALNLRLNKAIDLIKTTAKVTDAPKEEAAEAPKEEAPKEKAPRKRRTTKAKAEEAAEESKDAE